MKVFVPRPTMTEQTMCSSLYKEFDINDEYVPTEQEGLRYGFIVNATKELGNKVWALAHDFAEEKSEDFFIFNEVKDQIEEFKKWMIDKHYA